MIVFHYSKFRNFLSFGQRDVVIDLQESKTTLISGDSGAGKSSLIVEAITFCLFGKSFRKIKKGDLINSVNGKDCYTEVEFSIGSDVFKIVRGMKPEIFEIYQNGDLVNQNPNVRDYQKYLEENILRMSYKTWTSIVVLGFANHTPFMLLSSGERRQMVDEVLGIEAFQKMFDVAKSKVSELKTEISALGNQVDSIKESIALQKKNFRAIQSQEKEAEESLQKEIEGLLDSISSLESENLKIAEQIEPLFGSSSKKEAIVKKQNEMTKMLSKLKYRRNQLAQTIDFLETNIVCPSCKQNIEEDHKNKIKKEEESKLQELDSGIGLLDQRAEEFESSVRELDQEIQKITKLETSRTVNLRSIKHYQDQVTKKQEELGKIVRSDTTLTKTIAATIVDLAKKQDDLNNKKIELSDHLRHVVFCQSLLKEDGIKGKIINMYLPVLTKLVNDFLEAMNFSMRIVFDDGFNETIYARFRDKLSFTQLSQGEQSRVNLAIILAWRSLASMRNSVEVSILILDELLDSAISAADAEVVMELVREINKQQNIFIISHRPEQVAMYADSTIYVEKKGNFSVLSQ